MTRRVWDNTKSGRTIRLASLAICAMAGQEKVSLRPSTFVKGGTVIDDVDVEVMSGEVVEYNFPTNDGRTSPPSVCVKYVFRTEDGDHDEYLSAANPKFFAPSRDGKGLVSVSEKANLVENSKFAIFQTSLINLGWPENEVDSDVDFLVGAKIHIKRKPAPASWSSMEKTEGTRAKTILEATAILAYPGQAKGKGRTAARPAPARAAAPVRAQAQAPARAAAPVGAAAQAAAESNGNNQIDLDLVPLVQQALADGGPDGLTPKKDLMSAIFKATRGTEGARDLVSRCWQQEFLLWGMSEGYWGFDGETVTAM